MMMTIAYRLRTLPVVPFGGNLRKCSWRTTRRLYNTVSGKCQRPVPRRRLIANVNRRQKTIGRTCTALK